MALKGIDVSRWQTVIDFEKVKSSGIDFVIIKAGGSDKGLYTDSYFETNYQKAKAAGLKVGAYYFVGKKFLGAENGRADAQRFIAQLSGKQFDFPVYLDLETTEARYKKEATEAAIAFCEELEKAGFFVGIYASDISGFKDRLEYDKVKRFTIWAARYRNNPPEYATDYQIWQYSSKGSVPGIVGSVDMDTALTDFSKVIISKGFNGYPKKSKSKKKNEEA